MQNEFALRNALPESAIQNCPPPPQARVFYRRVIESLQFIA